MQSTLNSIQGISLKACFNRCTLFQNSDNTTTRFTLGSQFHWNNVMFRWNDVNHDMVHGTLFSRSLGLSVKLYFKSTQGVPHAFSTYVGTGDLPHIKYNKQLKSLLRKLIFTKCEVNPLCQNITYITKKGMGDRVSCPLLRTFLAGNSESQRIFFPHGN